MKDFTPFRLVPWHCDVNTPDVIRRGCETVRRLTADSGMSVRTFQDCSGVIGLVLLGVDFAWRGMLYSTALANLELKSKNVRGDRLQLRRAFAFAGKPFGLACLVLVAIPAIARLRRRHMKMSRILA